MKIRLFSLLTLLCCLLLGLPDPVHAQAPQYKVTVLGGINGFASQSWAYGINISGQVVGSSIYNGASHAVVWNGTTPIDLGTLVGVSQSWAYGINSSGQVVGSSYPPGDSVNAHAVVWNGTTPTDLGTLVGGSQSWACDINETGQVVGVSNISSDGSGNVYAVIWNGATPTALPNLNADISSSYANGVNDFGQVVGTSGFLSGAYHATIWNGTNPIDLGTLGGSSSFGNSINNSGQVVGSSYIPGGNGNIHAVIWNGTTPTDLGTLGGNESQAYGINASGTVVGFSQTSSGADDLFLYTGGNMYDLSNLILPVSGVTSISLEENSGKIINDSGQIAAVGFDDNGNRVALLLTPVPVAPTAATLLATSVTNTSATLNGTVNAGFGSTAVSFDYGLTASYGTNVSGTPTPLAGNSATAVSVNLSGLSPGTTYHYRVDGTNVAGTANGNDLTFTTQIAAASQIVNVDATKYGDFTVGLPSLNVSLPAGTYLLTPVNPQLDVRALYTAWDEYTGVNSWESELLIGLGSTGQPIRGMGIIAHDPTPSQAFMNPSNIPVIITLAAADTLLFGVEDQILGDNQGGISLTIQAITAPQAWRWTFFNTASNTGNSADAANPYNTGIPNLAVFAFMGPNQSPATAQFTQLPQLQVSNGNYVYSFTQPAGVSGVTYGAQYTTSLNPTNWQPITDTGSGTQHIFSVPIGSNTQLFLRLTVTEP